MEGLFEYEFPEDQSPVDDTKITTLLLYYSKEELKEVRAMCKTGMQQLLPETFKDSNISDFFITLLRKHYGSK